MARGGKGWHSVTIPGPNLLIPRSWVRVPPPSLPWVSTILHTAFFTRQRNPAPQASGAFHRKSPPAAREWAASVCSLGRGAACGGEWALLLEPFARGGFGVRSPADRL